MNIENFEIFEARRKNKERGGTMIGAHTALNPILVQEYSEDLELLVIEIKVKNRKIRLITGYRPQECWNKAERIPFSVALEKEMKDHH